MTKTPQFGAIEKESVTEISTPQCHSGTISNVAKVTTTLTKHTGWSMLLCSFILKDKFWNLDVIMDAIAWKAKKKTQPS